MAEEEKHPMIYAAICGVMADVGAVGKSKQTDKYKYRGIDDVMNALQPAMVKNKLFVIPQVLEEIRQEKQSRQGSVLFYTRLKIRYTFYAADGSNVSAEVIGEAMDSGDKATNKAMSIAYKYACFQVFSIPTEEMVDPDGEIQPPVKPTGQNQPKTSNTPPRTPNKPVLVDDAKINTLYCTMMNKGVTESQIIERYNVTRIEDLTVEQFTKAMNALNKMPDVEDNQLPWC